MRTKSLPLNQFKSPSSVSAFSKPFDKQGNQTKVLSPTSQNSSNVIFSMVKSQSDPSKPTSARAQRASRRSSATENIDSSKSIILSLLNGKVNNPGMPNIAWSSLSGQKVHHKVSVKPISPVKTFSSGVTSNSCVKNKNAVSDKVPCVNNTGRVVTRRSSGALDSGSSSPSKLQVNGCSSCIACDTMLLDKSISPRGSPRASPKKSDSSPRKVEKLNDKQVNILTRQMSGSTSSPQKVKKALESSSPQKLKKLHVLESESVRNSDRFNSADNSAVLNLEPSRRSKRLLSSGSLLDSGSPCKMRKIETM